MQLSISFNWPPGEDSAVVELGQLNIDDKNYQFRIGVAPAESKDKIAWFSEDWFNGDESMPQIKFTVRKVDTIILEKRMVGNSNVDSRNNWKISELWPAEATGPTMVHQGWIF
jgi:hypothetical protein